MKWRNKSLSYWLRVLHRDLGYLMVGACLIYAVSGILLNHMNGKDPAFRTTEAAVQLEKGMQAEELLAAWNRQEDLPPVKRVLSIDESHHRLMLEGGVYLAPSAFEAGFTSIAHGDKELEITFAAAERAFARLK